MKKRVSLDEMLEGTMGMLTDYEERKVALAKPKENNGIGVSTAWVDDIEAFETALLGEKTYPVERYDTRKEAVKGHKKWVKFARSGNGKTIAMLGMPGLVPDGQVVLSAIPDAH